MASWWGNGPLLAEALVPFTGEVAALLARTPSGEIASWPVASTVQIDGVCAEVTAPAVGIRPETAAEALCIGERIAAELGVTGVLAVEMFVVGEGADERVLVNELAMRPHNTGHWTIDGAVTSQFEQHLRAVLDLPLGSTQLRAPGTHAVMVNLLGLLPHPARARPRGGLRSRGSGCEGSPLRQGGAPGPQARPRHRRRRGSLPRS